MLGIPIWVMMVILCIAVSGVMAFRAHREEFQTEQQYIESEGRIYMDRLEQEKAKRNKDITIRNS